MEATNFPANWSTTLELEGVLPWDPELPRTPSSLWAALERRDLGWCQRCNEWGRRPWVRGSFALISRVGDGVAWYFLMAVLPLVRPGEGGRVAATMLLAGAMCLALYKALKRLFRRERPHVTHASIVLRARPLDRYSFPSGHTLHAAGFSVVVLALLPSLALVVLPFALLVALSRPVLGLHYPSDVLAGALVGGLVGLAALQVYALFLA